MLHKKRKLSTFTSSSSRDVAAENMLHSKSTYFYRWLPNLSVARRSYNSTNGKTSSKVGHNFANEFRESSHHCEQSNTASGTTHAILTRSRRQTNSYSKITDRPNYIVPVGCSLALLLGLGIILNPATNISSMDKAYAETITANPTDYSSISLTISHSNTDGSSTELNTGDTVSVNVEPGLISYISNNLKIDTKKINRFYVSIQAAEDSSSELTGIVNKATIAPVGSNKIPTATDDNGFGDNTWGFALGEASVDNSSMSYNSLPAYGTSTTPQYSSATNLADGTYNLKLTFAAKINADKPSDHYTTKAMVSVAADAKEIMTMQEFAEVELCSTLNVHDALRLIDDRTISGAGQKTYWVAKLADGNCWMTQNLDLEIPASGLKAADTAITSDWAGGVYAPQQTKTGNISGSWSSVQTEIQSWDPGMYVYINPAATLENCASSPIDLDDCGTSWKKVDSTYVADSSINKSTDVTNTINEAAKIYDAHYLIGNFYSWNAATAGTGNIITSGGATSSICPKGWMLPTSGADNTSSGSFGGLFATEAEDVNIGNWSVKIRKYPLFYLPSGAVNATGLYSTGTVGDWWSLTPYADERYAYFFSYYRGAGFNTATGFNRYEGRSVRCLVEG